MSRPCVKTRNTNRNLSGLRTQRTASNHFHPMILQLSSSTLRVHSKCVKLCCDSSPGSNNSSAIGIPPFSRIKQQIDNIYSTTPSAISVLLFPPSPVFPSQSVELSSASSIRSPLADELHDKCWFSGSRPHSSPLLRKNEEHNQKMCVPFFLV